MEISKSTNAVFVPNNYYLDWEKLKTIGEHRSFEWNRPEHMKPKGEPSLIEIQERLEKHFHECLNHLAFIKNDEGVLYKTMMSVNNLGKIDVYHYIYFLVQHSKRHLSQMQKIKIEFNELYDR